MKKQTKLFFAMIIVYGLICLFVINTSDFISAENKTPPPYAKWGELAMKKTKEKYPDAQITDYLHIGRETMEDSSLEKFKLILKRDSKEFGLFVNIEFKTETEQVIEITFKETTA
jgi:hypothetical protein